MQAVSNRASGTSVSKERLLLAWLTLEVAGCGDIEPISEPIVPQSFGLSLAPARNNDVIVRTPCRSTFTALDFTFFLFTTSKATRVLTAPYICLVSTKTHRGSIIQGNGIPHVSKFMKGHHLPVYFTQGWVNVLNIAVQCQTKIGIH